MPVAPQSVRTQSSHQYLFTLLGSTQAKAVRTMLMNLTQSCLVGIKIYWVWLKEQVVFVIHTTMFQKWFSNDIYFVHLLTSRYLSAFSMKRSTLFLLSLLFKLSSFNGNSLPWILCQISLHYTAIHICWSLIKVCYRCNEFT